VVDWKATFRQALMRISQVYWGKSRKLHQMTGGKGATKRTAVLCGISLSKPPAKPMVVIILSAHRLQNCGRSDFPPIFPPL